MTTTVVAVADTVLGYGSSQVLSVTKALANLLGYEHLIFQPFVPHRRFVDLRDSEYRIETITSVEHPWSWIGRMQYLRRVALWLNDHRPDVLVLPNYNMLPIIDLLCYKPQKIVHLVLEDMEQFGTSYWAKLVVRKIKAYVGKIDVWVFPEENRAVHDCAQLNIPFDRVCIFYNVMHGLGQSRAASENNGRVIYAGAVDFSRTAAKFFSSPPVAAEAIDVFGGLAGSDGQRKNFLTAVSRKENRIRYYGEVAADELERRLPDYAYSLVYWFPKNWALRNAAPNKFFQAVASGVPVIAAPHPQCLSLIKRYKCGIALSDWSYETFVSSLKVAIRKIGTSEHQDMVAGCFDAHTKELNWGRQFKKLETLFLSQWR